jgi:hypothetical protein
LARNPLSSKLGRLNGPFPLAAPVTPVRRVPVSNVGSFPVFFKIIQGSGGGAKGKKTVLVVGDLSFPSSASATVTLVLRADQRHNTNSSNILSLFSVAMTASRDPIADRGCRAQCHFENGFPCAASESDGIAEEFKALELEPSGSGKAVARRGK